MYFRFDPDINKEMQDFDLLRIIQAQQGSPKNTAISFVNPRIEIQNAEKDQIIPFVLASDQKVKEIFNLLNIASRDRIKTVDTLKNYSKISKNTSSSDTSAIMNPSKQKSLLLGDLQTIFSNAVNEEITVEQFHSKTEKILQDTKELNLDNTARKMIEQFLIDGRFALYNTDSVESHYQKLYEEAASILGINPTTGKEKMFQVLSNIFSKNLLVDKLSNNQMSIDTVAVLNNTLTQAKNEIATSDYFDISLYSFLLLRVMADEEGREQMNTTDKSLVSMFYRTLLSRATLEKDALYSVYATIFSATQRYATGIVDKTQAENAQAALANDFYNPMLYLLVNSLYQTYTHVENGKILLSKSFENRGVPELSSANHKEIVAHLSSVHTLLSDVYYKKIKDSINPRAISVRPEIEKYLAQLQGFITMLDANNYREYLANPYIAENK